MLQLAESAVPLAVHRSPLLWPRFSPDHRDRQQEPASADTAVPVGDRPHIGGSVVDVRFEFQERVIEVPTSLPRQYSSSGRSIRGADATLSCFAADRPNQGSSALRQTEPATLRPVKPPYSTTHQGHCDDIDHPQTR
jgi:hypothetical protein